MKKAAKIIGSTFGAGFSPVAPGTAGSLVAIAALWFTPSLSAMSLIFFIVIFYFVGVWASTICETDWGHDPGRVVWDEVVGMMITVVALPKQWLIYLVAFAAFRFFDILKPFPINSSQRLPRGWGVMTDDVLAGIYANLVLQLLFRIIFTNAAG